MPVGNVLVGDSGGNIEHDDTALSVDVVTITETTELLLSCGIPDVELQFTEVGEETERARKRSISVWPDRTRRWKNVLDLDTQSGNVLLLELSSQVTLDEGGL